jgi:phenylacetate-CoA ligase
LPQKSAFLWDVAYTTGTTTGRPSPFYNTAHDAYAIWDQARRCNEAEGLIASDRVANLYPLAGFPTGAFLSVIRSAMIAGVPVVHGLTGAANSEFKVRNSLAEALATIERFRPTVLWGVPSFIRRFLDEACRRGADFSAVRLVLTSGEPVPATLRTALRDHLARLGAPLVSIRARYAFTEMQGGLVQCAEDAAVQNIVPDLYHLEVVEPATGRRLAEGESGALAITHLHRRGTVLLRYLVGDIVMLSRAPCPHCGRAGERVVATPRRTGNLVKCRGMLVNTDVILDTLSAMAEIAEFQVVFAPAPASGEMEQLLIRLERDADATLREEVVRRVREAVSLRPEVEFVARGVLYDHERAIKAKRVVDLRERTD